MKPLPQELENKIDEVKSWLFDGDQLVIADKARRSAIMVNLVLNKKQFSAHIFECAIEVMNENKRRFEISTLKVAM